MSDFARRHPLISGGIIIFLLIVLLSAFPIGFAPGADGLLNEPMFGGLQKVRPGVNHTGNDPAEQAEDIDTVTTAF